MSPPIGTDTTTHAPSTASTREWVGLGAMLGATFVGQFDGFVVVVALPSIQRDLAASFGQAQLAAAAFVFACAAGLVTAGRIGDRYGRRATFLVSVVGFSVASLLCGLAPNPGALIAARFAQGISAAAMIPQVLSIIRAMFHDPAQRARAIGGYGVAIGLGVICGLAGGGLLVHLDLAGLGWRVAFLVMVPIGAAILLLGVRTIPESRSSSAGRLDLAGATLTLIGLPALLVPLILGPGYGAPLWIWASGLLAVVMGVALVVQQRRTAARGGDPLFAPHVLATRGFPMSLWTLVIFFAGNSGLFLIFTYYVQTGLAVDPLLTGMLFVPLGVGFVAGSAASERLARRFAMRVAVAGGGILAGSLIAGALIVQLPLGWQRPLLAVMVGVAGLGQGLVVSPLLAGILGRIAPDDAGAAAGVATTVTQFGLAFGFATAGISYRAALGAAPGDPDTPVGQAVHVEAFTLTVLLLAVAALATSLLCLRLQRLG
jgi:MFS family permease